MNRAELQSLATDRLEDAATLIAHRRWSAAYYLAGYAVECGLKACILRYIDRTGIIFEDKKFGERCFTHRIADLVAQAGLKSEWEHIMKTSSAFGLNWNIVLQWDETSRYKQAIEADALAIFAAITAESDGVLAWIKKYW